ncbi:DUF3046 domain-containing protein [Pengzhenrongella sicca]|uniref:DUF3046 domain-containing protein n=1 Tax=Pengzhenrongella sicca TaxID=2819238 RepID=A0A8A4ZJB0_9MICO|nr:DUF3046 domain-containing protein [Pengzhenrongella sicca]QTE30607.1 DUF3046 domain-containing protein [Pengzhenrongella sicca]
MRHREFWALVDEVFGRVYGRTLAGDQVIGALENRTAAQAIEDGVEPRTVWHALCDALDVPQERRWGADAQRPAPPRG